MQQTHVVQKSDKEIRFQIVRVYKSEFNKGVIVSPLEKIYRLITKAEQFRLF